MINISILNKGQDFTWFFYFLNLVCFLTFAIAKRKSNKLKFIQWNQ